MDMEIGPVDRGMCVVGTALTVETANGDNFPIHVASYHFEADGYVMVIDGKGCRERAYFGVNHHDIAVSFQVIDVYKRQPSEQLTLQIGLFLLSNH